MVVVVEACSGCWHLWAFLFFFFLYGGYPGGLRDSRRCVLADGRGGKGRGNVRREGSI